MRYLNTSEKMVTSKAKDFKRLSRVVKALLKHGLGRIVYDHGITAGLNLLHIIKLRKQKEFPEDLPIKIRLVLEDLGGAYVKLGQLLSIRPDLIPQEYCDELKKLTDDAESYNFDIIKKVVEKEFEKPLENVFKEFDEKPLGSASIAQVHKAKLLFGKSVVVKIQKPFVEQDFETDIDIMHYVARKIDLHYKNSFSAVDIVKEFEEYTKKELNFINEGQNIDKFFNLFKNSKTVIIPKVHWQYSTKKVLVMNFIDGKKLSEIIKNSSGINKRVLVQTIVNCSIKQTIEDGYFHADLHPGNILVLESNKIALIDFGIVGRLPDHMRVKGLKLFSAIINNDIDEVFRLCLSVGTQTNETNLDALKNDIAKLMHSYLDDKTKKVFITHLLYRLLLTCVKNKLKLSVDLLLYGKSFVTVEGTCIELLKDFNFIEFARPKMIEIMKKEKTPKAVFKRFLNKSRVLAESIVDIPKEALEFLERLKTGKFTFDMENTDVRHLGMDINLSSNRLAYAIVSASLIIASAFFIEKPPLIKGYSLISLVLLGIAIILVISLLLSIRREGTDRYDPHKKF